MNNYRLDQAKKVRLAAMELAASRIHPRHLANGDEHKFRVNCEGTRVNCEGVKENCKDIKNQPSYLMSFTKGMMHHYHTGLLCNPDDFQKFVKGIDNGAPRDFIETPLGPSDNYVPGDTSYWRSEKAHELGKVKLRAWESEGAGNLFDLEGPDAQSVTMPPAPRLGSHELTAEMGEVYVQALLRDVPFSKIVAEIDTYTVQCSQSGATKTVAVSELINDLKQLHWFGSNDGCKITANGKDHILTDDERKRLRRNLDGQTLFRGITPGDRIGPYISQFLLAGTSGRNGNKESSDGQKPAHGLINYGSLVIDQRVRYAKPCKDYMTNWDEWYDVQHAADFGEMEEYSSIIKDGHTYYRRFITTPRDIATYVHYDALYEAYLNAALILMDSKTPFDPGIPYQLDNHLDHQQGFAHFGGPHILSLVTEVATRALKAVRFQKFNVHRRARPEVLGRPTGKTVLWTYQ